MAGTVLIYDPQTHSTRYLDPETGEVLDTMDPEAWAALCAQAAEEMGESGAPPILERVAVPLPVAYTEPTAEERQVARQARYPQTNGTPWQVGRVLGRLARAAQVLPPPGTDASGQVEDAMDVLRGELFGETEIAVALTALLGFFRGTQDDDQDTAHTWMANILHAHLAEELDAGVREQVREQVSVWVPDYSLEDEPSFSWHYVLDDVGIAPGAPPPAR